jgi:predicted 3-demethylubiquinone-9 3-methyltransferase (glyoxalase superfamily)
MKMQKIIPYLWFENQAEEAANFYLHTGSLTRMNYKFPKNRKKTGDSLSDRPSKCLSSSSNQIYRS